MLKSLSYLWRLVGPHLKGQRRLLWTAFALAVAASACGLGALVLVKRAVNADLGRGDAQAFAGSLGLAAAMYAFTYAVWWTQQTVAAVATERLFVELKARLLSRVLEQPRQFFDRVSRDTLESRLKNELFAVTGFFRDLTLALCVDILLMTVLIAAVISQHLAIGLCLAAVVILHVPALLLSGTYWQMREVVASDEEVVHNDLFYDIVGAIRDIKVFNLKPSMERRFGQALDVMARSQIVLRRSEATVRNLFGLANALSLLALVGSAGYLLLKKDPSMPLGQFAMVATLLVIVMATLSQAMVKVGRLTTAGPSLRRAAAMLGDDAPEPVLTRANTTQLPDTPSIELADVSYLRTSGRAVFARLNLRIEAGEKVALVGATGSGKSTVLDLIMRLRTPYSGRILYSDIDVRELPQDLYYSAFGFVGQDNYLMQITVRAYLQQAWPNQTDDALWRVLALVKLERESRCLSLGLDTDLGPAGGAISPSQRARLSVARALLRDPQVLILDEFTARLDPEAQADLIADVLAQSKNRTVICSTNSPAVAALFERVIVLPGPGG